MIDNIGNFHFALTYVEFTNDPLLLDLQQLIIVIHIDGSEAILWDTIKVFFFDFKCY